MGDVELRRRVPQKNERRQRVAGLPRMHRHMGESHRQIRLLPGCLLILTNCCTVIGMIHSGQEFLLRCLRSFDGETFEVDEAVALESETIKHLIEDDCANTSIPLHNVTGKILAKVIEYCKRHVEDPKAEDKTAKEDLKTFDAEFVKVDQSTLFNLMLVIVPPLSEPRDKVT
ncbi:hypothetical protein KY284_005599 [Solanum tuberosum]|nr:hypothetical protein KY284_005599 [Solanum tuberosum]